MRSATGPRRGASTSPGPEQLPNAFSSLPFGLTDFSIDVDVNAINDGGVWLRSAAAPATSLGIIGVLFVTADGESYWHIVTDGSSYGSAPQPVAGPPTGSSPHLRIEVTGDTYAAFLDGSATPITTLTTSAFAVRAGRGSDSTQPDVRQRRPGDPGRRPPSPRRSPWPDGRYRVDGLLRRRQAGLSVPPAGPMQRRAPGDESGAFVCASRRQRRRHSGRYRTFRTWLLRP